MLYNGSMKRLFSVYLLAVLTMASAFSQQGEEQNGERSRRQGANYQYIFGPIIQEQRNQINQEDAANAALDAELAATRSPEQNALIQSYTQIINGHTAAIIANTPDQSMAAFRQVLKIERLKRQILEFMESDDYAPDSPEIKNIMETLNEEYQVLESSTYTVTSLERNLIFRVSSYDQNIQAWQANIYSNFFSYTTVFRHTAEMPYQDLIGKHSSFANSSTMNEREQFVTNVVVADSLFRQAIPLVYVKLSFRVLKWKNASEYRFVPIECELIRTDTGKVVKKFSHAELTQENFIISPTKEIRTEAQKNIEIERINKLLEKEDQLYEPVKQHETGLPLFGIQKGRRAFYVTSDPRLYRSDLEQFDIRDVKLNALKINLDFGIGPFSFLGGAAGYDYDGSFERVDYSLSINGGVNVMMKTFMRPYLIAEGAFHTNYDGIFTLGGGIDFIIGRLMLNVNYGYNWNHSFESFFLHRTGRNDHPNLQYHTFAAGVGFTW